MRLSPIIRVWPSPIGPSATIHTFFRLTKPRKTILDLLRRYTYLRTSHFYLLLRTQGDGAQRAVRRLLHDSWKRGYLVRRPIIDYNAPGPLPRYENVHWLSPPGVALGRDSGCFDEGLNWTREQSPHSLEHDIAITDFHLAVERFCAATGWTLYWQQHGLKRTVNPDPIPIPWFSARRLPNSSCPSLDVRDGRSRNLAPRFCSGSGYTSGPYVRRIHCGAGTASTCTGA